MGKEQELLEAARNGNIAVVEKILFTKSKRSGPLASLRRGPGSNAQDSSGYSALHHASLNGHADIVRVLLAHDASPNLPDARGSSPLHLAAWAGHQDIVNMLLTHPHRPAKPNMQTDDNQTPLHFAAQHGHTGALTTLLAHSADPNMTNNRGETPLELAAQYGRLQVVQMLIRAHPELLLPFRLTNNGQTPLVGHSPLHLASRNGHRNVVVVLLAAGVCVNLRTASGTALHEAALCGKDRVVRALLDAGADLEATDADGRTALDLLEQFPPHVTRGIVAVINNHRTSAAYESESDDVRDAMTIPRRDRKNRFIKPIALDNSYEHNHIQHSRRSPMQDIYWDDHHMDGISPSSSMSSFEPPSPTPRPRAATATNATPGFYVTMAPINSSKVSPTPPKKPPRRNLSVSPTHLMSTSMDGDMMMQHYHSGSQRNTPYEYLFLSRSGSGHSADQMVLNGHGGGGGGGGHVGIASDSEAGVSSFGSKGRAASVDQYVHMSLTHPQPAPRNLNSGYDNMQPRSFNTNRKLRRNRETDLFVIDRNPTTNHASKVIATRSQPLPKTPTSPSHYNQPPTPEHPPPSAVQAERCIQARIRPLSQEYKRRSAALQMQHQGDISNYDPMMLVGSSPPGAAVAPMCQSSLGASSGSLSSSVSQSDRSASTDCVEEFIGDAPFSGLFKGSTMNLNATNQTYHSQPPNNVSNGGDSTGTRAERPTTLRTKTQAKPNEPTPQNRTESHANGTVAVTLSPFDEQEEWAKISEIMAKFGTEGANEVKLSKGEKTRRSLSASRSVGSPMDVQSLTTQIFTNWLQDVELSEHEDLLTKHGFNDIDFLNGILDKSDAIDMGLNDEQATALITAIRELPRPTTFHNQQLAKQQLENNNNKEENSNPVATGLNLVNEWLTSIRLHEYFEVFRRHLYTDMERISRVWEVELQAVLEISKIGHRKRILYTVAGPHLSPPQMSEICEPDIILSKASSNPPTVIQTAATSQTAASYNTRTNPNGTATRTNHGKNRMAPQPPKPAVNLEIRAPAELLLGVPVGLQANWRHMPADLVSGLIKYEVNYLGSTVIKEHRGTESTRKSIQKLKRDDRGGTSAVQQEAITENGTLDTSSLQTAPNGGKRPLLLSISHRGVRFIDIETQGTICEHEIRNIDCACQDSDDLSHFAYITKDANLDKHYCHVFNVESMDLATTIILTLGQAFEVAYQLALRDASAAATTPIRSPANGEMKTTILSSQNGHHSTSNTLNIT